MSKFADLLKQPLPSQADAVVEEKAGEDYTDTKKEMEEHGGGTVVDTTAHTIDANADPTAEGGMKEEPGHLKEGEIKEDIKPVTPDHVDDKQPVTSVNANDKGSESLPVSMKNASLKGAATESAEGPEVTAKEEVTSEGAGCEGPECGEKKECGDLGVAPSAECGDAGCMGKKECGDMVESDDDEESIEDMNLDDFSDEDLDNLEDALKDSDIDDAIGDVPEVELSADEEREADDAMALAATAALLKDEFSANEFAQFMENGDEARKLVYEGFLLESDLKEFAGPEVGEGMVTEASQKGKIYAKTMVRFSKKARLAQLFAVAVNVSAAAHNDPDYRKLKKVMKIRKMLRKKLMMKYKGEATRRMKTYFRRLKASRSSTLNKIASDVEKDTK